MKKINYIYWFAYYNEDSPSVRYRAQYPLEYFKENYKINSSLILPGYRIKNIFSFIISYFSALLFRKDHSIIVIQRVHSNFIYSNLLKLLVCIQNNNTIYDLDDADYLYYRSKSIYWFAKKCHYISAGSRAIANHLSKFNGNVFITSSPTPDLKIIKKKKNDVFKIGWIGFFGGSHKKGLISYVFPAIKNLSFNCIFSIIGVIKDEDEQFIIDYFKHNKHIKIEIPRLIDWKNEFVIQKKIVSFDIGISTLLETEIQMSKSGIKAKQYLNNGIPVLATNLPENDCLIKDGINGYFCQSVDDFKKRIIEFYKMDINLYRRFSTNARKSISEFNHNKYYSDLTKFIQQ